jgi:hypothetical protein
VRASLQKVNGDVVCNVSSSFVCSHLGPTCPPEFNVAVTRSDLANLSPPATPARSPSAATVSQPVVLPVARCENAAVDAGQEQDEVHVHAGLSAYPCVERGASRQDVTCDPRMGAAVLMRDMWQSLSNRYQGAPG